MSDAITFDFDELHSLAADLGAAPERVGPAVYNVTKRGAMNIKKGAVAAIRERMSGPGETYLPRYPRSIDYDIEYVEGAGGGVMAEIGPNKAKSQGPLGHILEFGSVRSAPIPHLIPAWQEELSNYSEQLAIALERATLGSIQYNVQRKAMLDLQAEDDE